MTTRDMTPEERTKLADLREAARVQMKETSENPFGGYIVSHLYHVRICRDYAESLRQEGVRVR